MIEMQDVQVQVMIAPATVTLATNSTTYGYLDGIGWDYATILVCTRAIATTSAAFKVLQLREGTNSTAATAIVAFTGGTATSASAGFVIPVFEGTSHGTICRFNVDLRKRERYLRLQVGPGNTKAGASAVAILSRGKQFPDPASDGHVAVAVTG